eukprot:4802685-Amphidinium_carterae.1
MDDLLDIFGMGSAEGAHVEDTKDDLPQSQHKREALSSQTGDGVKRLKRSNIVSEETLATAEKEEGSHANARTHSSTLWWTKLEKAFREHFQARGSQLRPLSCASLCSGLGTDVFVLQQARTETSNYYLGCHFECHERNTIDFCQFLRPFRDCGKSTTKPTQPHPASELDTSKAEALDEGFPKMCELLPQMCHCSEAASLVATKHMYTCDPKPSATKFVLDNIKDVCHFNYISEVTQATCDASVRLQCQRHGECGVPSGCPNKVDFLSVGFPCAPFSFQRSRRHCAGR